MNNAAIAGLLAVLVFVVLASVCAFPFFNCAKREKFRGGSGPTVFVTFDNGRNTSGMAYSLNVTHKMPHIPPKHVDFDYTSLNLRIGAPSYKVVFYDSEGNILRAVTFVPGKKTVRVTFVPKQFQPSTFLIVGTLNPDNGNCKNGTYTFTMTRSTGKPPVTGCLPNPGVKMELSKQIVSMNFAAKTQHNRISWYKSDGKVITSTPGNVNLGLDWLTANNPSYLILK